MLLFIYANRLSGLSNVIMTFLMLTTAAQRDMSWLKLKKTISLKVVRCQNRIAVYLDGIYMD